MAEMSYITSEKERAVRSAKIAHQVAESKYILLIDNFFHVSVHLLQNKMA